MVGGSLHQLARVLALAAAAAVVGLALSFSPSPLHVLWSDGTPRMNPLTAAHPEAVSAYFHGGLQQPLSETRNPLPAVDHKPIWPLNARDVVMFGIATVAIFIAAGGGIGGGGVLVPLFILAGEFSTRQAVALSNITIMGGALANFCCNVFRKHGTSNKPLIDWDLILVMEPATIVGALLGGYLNKLLPVWLTTTLLAVLLSLMTHKLAAKGLQMFNKESFQLPLTAPLLTADHSPAGAEDSDSSEDYNLDAHIPRARSGVHLPGTRSVDAAAAANGHGEVQDGNGQGENGHREGNGMALVVPTSPGAAARTQQQQERADNEEVLQGLLKAEATQVPLLKLSVLVAVSAWVVVSDTAKEEVPCGSWRYWVIVLSLLPCVAVVTLEMRRYLLWKGAVKAAAGHGQDELKWTPLTTLLYPAISSFAGLFAGLFGVGGGIVKGPLMLELGVRPDVAAATAATMILFTAGAACIIFVHFGGVVWDYALPLLVLGFLVTLAGQLATYRLVQRLGRRSVIVFMMAALMAMATLIMYYQTVAGWVDLARHPGDLGRTGHICSAHSSGPPHTAPAP